MYQLPRYNEILDIRHGFLINLKFDKYLTAL